MTYYDYDMAKQELARHIAKIISKEVPFTYYMEGHNNENK